MKQVHAAGDSAPDREHDLSGDCWCKPLLGYTPAVDAGDDDPPPDPADAP